MEKKAGRPGQCRGSQAGQAAAFRCGVVIGRKFLFCTCRKVSAAMVRTAAVLRSARNRAGRAQERRHRAMMERWNRKVQQKAEDRQPQRRQAGSRFTWAVHALLLDPLDVDDDALVGVDGETDPVSGAEPGQQRRRRYQVVHHHRRHETRDLLVIDDDASGPDIG
jgi:hypothetical protein